MGGLNRGLIAEMIGNGTGILDGQLQVHDSEYLPERSLYETIGGREGTDVERLVAAVAADPFVSASTPRVFAGGLVSSGDGTVAAALIGIDPAREPAVSTILSTLDEGRLPLPGANELIVGREMARQLSFAAGDEAVLVAPAADGSMGNDLFTVAGVFDTGLAELDRGLALLPIGALQRLIALPESRIHEIAARVEDPWHAPEVAARLAGPIAGSETEAEVSAWTTFRPEMVSYATMAEGVEWMLLVIVFVIAIFGVANTMLMATFERRHEFALLLALGTTPGVIVRSVLAEAVVLSTVSLVAGAVITAPILVWWHLAPPDMSWLYGGTTLAGGLMRPILRVEYPWLMIVEAAVALFLTAVLAALYPAWRSARVPPADTLTGR
jgi:ABC-type lipoprotein release transport system permease subunit